MPILSPQKLDAICSASVEIKSNPPVLRSYWYHFHRRYCSTADVKSKSNDLLVARALSILLWFYVIIIEFLAYSHLLQSSIALNFLVSAADSWRDVSSIIYASGAAAYGISFEVYLIMPILIVNNILACINCQINHSETIDSFIYTIKVITLLVGTELSHQNFKRFTYRQSYQLHYLSATRAMVRQSIYLTVTIMFLVSPGLRAVYNAARLRCPYLYETTNGSSCHLIDLNRPAFTDNDPCMPDFAAMIVSYEQVRIIRDIALCSIAFYSMYNKAFLDITGTSGVIHKIVLILFIAMSCAYIVANIDPLQFNKFRLYFNLIETLMVIIVSTLLILNLRKKCKYKERVIMEANPTLFG